MDFSKKTSRLQKLFTERGWKLSVAESCSGGGLSSAIVQQPGSSSYYLGGIVSYSNEIKNELLDVQMSSIQCHGAVSIPVAREMARGVQKKFASHWSVSTTGVAGPEGGSDEKPIGTVCFAVVGPGIEWWTKQEFKNSDRQSVIDQSVDLALDSLWSLATD